MLILQKLWYGNIKPNEDKVIADKEKELVELIVRHHETLSSSLKKDDLDVFEKYVDCFTEYASLIECQAFEIGFKFLLNIYKLTICQFMLLYIVYTYNIHWCNMTDFKLKSQRFKRKAI